MLCVSKRSMVLTSSKFTGLQHMLNIIVVFPDDFVKTDSAGKSEAFFFPSILKAINYWLPMFTRMPVPCTEQVVS